MKKLTKIKLINWYTFENETIDLYGNCLISGANGSGKSTLLDAIQFILTAGGTQFNKAADEKSKRNLESYVRGKIGTANKEYLRNGDVTSYVALQFHDYETKTKDIIGACIEVSSGFKPKRIFFRISSMDINDEIFIEKNKPKTMVEFRRVQSIEIFETKGEIKQMIRAILGVCSDKYFELIPRALAFKPIDENLDNFVNDVLLSEKEIDLHSLQQNIQNLTELQEIIKNEENKIKELEKLEKDYESYKNCLSQKKFYDWAKLQFQILSRQEIIQKLEAMIHNLEAQHTDKTKNIELEEISLASLEQDIDNYKKSNESNSDFNIQDQLQKDILKLKEQHENFKKEYKMYQNYFEKEIKIAQNIKCHILEKVELNQIEALNKCLYEYKKYVESKKREFQTNYHQYEDREKEVSDKINICDQKLERLHKKQMPYEPHIICLQDEIKVYLSEKYNINVEVRPLCEYIDITDEKWRDAIEGYLNTQRFDLIVEPQYFDDALNVYESIKKEKKIYGVGLVNVKKLDLEDIIENTLATKIKSNYNYAYLYAIKILNKVVCCEDINMLKSYNNAITPTCMAYRNHVARQINPNVYQDYYIGTQAYEKQLSKYTKVQKEYNTLLQNIQSTMKNYNNQLLQIQESRIDELLRDITVLKRYNRVNEEMNQKQDDLNKMQTDGLVYDMMQKLNELYAKYETKKKEINQIKDEKRKLELQIDENNEKLDMLYKELTTIKDSVTEKEVDYEEKIKKISYSQIDNLYSKNEIILMQLQTSIESLQSKYNEQYEYDEIPSIDTVQKYITTLYQIREKDIVKYKADSVNFQTQCRNSFEEDFISHLRNNIISAQGELKELNRALKNKRFGQDGEKYEFVFEQSDDPELAKYYEIIMSGKDYTVHSLFDETLTQDQKEQMEELFRKLTTPSEYVSTCHYTDYRKYMSYDIRVTKNNGDSYKLSHVVREKSGGETQTPFYFIIASSFEQLLKSGIRKGSIGCVVLLDEAFNRMDESRIEAMMHFYNELNIQLLIAVPPQQLPSIAPYVNTNLLIETKDYDSFVIPYRIEDLMDE